MSIPITKDFHHGLLGGWIHASAFSPWVLQRNPDKREFGLGFRMHEPKKKWLHWPPLPSTQPNPVGIDGVLEGLCPPYVASMNDAVDAVVADKYGPQGTYGDAQTFAPHSSTPRTRTNICDSKRRSGLKRLSTAKKSPRTL